nr:hypothetical protein [Deinococcota bacterium]
MTRLDKFKLAQFKLVQVLLVSSLVFTVVHAQNSTGPEGHLVVADPEASTLYVYELPGLELTGQLDGVTLDTHAGFLPLSEGRLLFIDQSSAQLLALEITEDGEAAIVGRASVGIPASHLAVDGMMNYVVTGSDEEGKTLTVVDLNSYESVSVAVDSGDPGLAVAGNPAVIYHRHPEGRLEAYRVESILAGNAEPLDTTEIGPAGHGEAVSHGLNRVYVATDDGVDSVDVTADGLGDQRTLPYDASGREGGRAYFVRVTDNYLYSYLRVMDSQETPWQDWQNDIYIIDLSTEEVSRSDLGPGLVFRFAISEPYALFFNIHPNGDFAHLLDIDPASTTFHE